jgi:hypothetical protein
MARAMIINELGKMSVDIFTQRRGDSCNQIGYLYATHRWDSNGQKTIDI